MTRENKPNGVTDKANDYAFWAIPGSNAAVTYSLPLFHEIDFAVNEGFRKIPHGGIEEGGLLFGTIDDKGTRIEAFRPIVCEHASGPSFLLSDHDLDQLSAQIAAAASDADLQGLELVGWFLAHTRGPLVLTDREADLCDHYFSHPGMVTVLVKPERFQPTRFVFLVRAADGTLPHDVSKNAIILPLPGRSAKATGGPIASIPAPALPAAAARLASEAELGDETEAPLEEPAALIPPTTAGETKPIVAATPPATPLQNRGIRRQRRLNIDQVRQKEEEKETVSSAEGVETHEVPTGPPLIRRGRDLAPLRRGGVAASSSESALALNRSHDLEEMDATPDAYQQMEMLNQKRPVSTTARLVMVLPLAALLGCLVGYVAYLQVPSPIIPLTVKGMGENVIVTWPPEQTRSAVYAAVRVDDSTPVMLTPEEKTTGRVEVHASPDMKVELIARNWMRDSRGIVHYLKPLANTAP